MKQVKRQQITRGCSVEVRSFLENAYPPLFVEKRVPFAIGIKDQLVDLHPDLPAREISSVIGQTVSCPRYLLNFADNAMKYRYNLDGTEAQLITAADRDFATKRLLDMAENKVSLIRRVLGDEGVEALLSHIEKI